jgi:hypothetical protein
MTVGPNLHSNDENAGRAAMTPRPPLPLDLPLDVRRQTRGRRDRDGFAITRNLRLVGHVRNS